MNRNKKSLLIALSIGDGHIESRKDKRCNHVQNSISFIHCEKQKEYIEYKALLIQKIFGGKKPNVTKVNNSGYVGYRMMKTDKYFRILYKLLYPNGKKYITRKCLDYLTPKGIAIWYMDDGNLSKKKRNGKVHSYELFLNTFVSDEETQTIIDYFEEKWNIKFAKVKNNNGYRLRCGTIEARKFIKIIDRYVISSMKYKTDISKKNI